MAIKVADHPSQSFSTSFALKGSAQQGELSLFSPLGNTVARLTWNPGLVSLHTASMSTDYASLDDLMLQATGTALPVAALFDWLIGTATPVAGWQIDLSQQSEGRLTARRTDPATELRLVLER